MDVCIVCAYTCEDIWTCLNTQIYAWTYVPVCTYMRVGDLCVYCVYVCVLLELCLQVMTLTNEGGRLKRDKTLVQGRDFELLPEPVWCALSGWYGGSPALPRTVSSAFLSTHLHNRPIKANIMGWGDSLVG